MKKPAIKIIKNPRITEKASLVMEQNVYLFDVSLDANKKEISDAVFDIYKVRPLKVNVLKVPRKKTSLKGRKSSTDLGKKAFVYLKKEDKIEII